MEIHYPELYFGELERRYQTDAIVIHHSNGGNDVDFSVEQIHQMHLDNGYSGVGYHFVIRKDGTLEIGRPEDAVGAHAEGHNYYTLGICFSGDFTIGYPTAAQMETCAELLRDLSNDYHIPLDRDHIKAHRELNETDCPGDNLYARFDDIIAEARGDIDAPHNHIARPVQTIFDLARRYETTGNPASVGHFYGLYQFTPSVANEFVAWLKNYPDPKLANYGRCLDAANNFDGEWAMLGTVDPGNFGKLQDEFALEHFYKPVSDLLHAEDFHTNKHSLALQAVVFARAIQHGVYGCLELLKRACPYPNLSYCDSAYFDDALIAAIYSYLQENPCYGLSTDRLSGSLRERFHCEKEDALC